MPLPLLALLALGGAGAQIAGRILGRVAEHEAEDAEERRLRQISAMLRHQAGDVRLRSNEQAGRVVTEASQQTSAIKVAMAAGGVDPNSGSAALLQASSDAWGESDARRVQLNAIRQARGLEAQAAGAERQAKQIDDSQTMRDIGAAIGIAGSAAGSFAGISQDFNLFGGELPAEGASTTSGLAAAAPVGDFTPVPTDERLALRNGRWPPLGWS